MKTLDMYFPNLLPSKREHKQSGKWKIDIFFSLLGIIYFNILATKGILAACLVCNISYINIGTFQCFPNYTLVL